MNSTFSKQQISQLEAFFKQRLQKNVPLDRHSVMRVGGPADFLVEIESAEDLERSARFLWEAGLPFLVIGGGANLLISDSGVREIVLLNQAKAVRFMDEPGHPPRVWAESGASFGSLARRTGNRGWRGLEWAAGIPGSVGGAVVGNAGAHGSDVAANLYLADILHHKEQQIQRESWSVDLFAYDYRYSIIKSGAVSAVVLTATFQLERGEPEEAKAEISRISEKRRSSQPQGASLGSMFKNPPGDYAGRLIEAAGLKGTRSGGAVISPVHGNFFINQGEATARDLYALINLAKKTVSEQFGVDLELEILLVGEWEEA